MVNGEVSQRTLRKWLILCRLLEMKALCACKTDERTVNGNIRAGESLPRNVEDEKSPENMGRVGKEWVKHGSILDGASRKRISKVFWPRSKNWFQWRKYKIFRIWYLYNIYWLEVHLILHVWFYGSYCVIYFNLMKKLDLDCVTSRFSPYSDNW